ncbi:hypothetical protein [Rhodococcus sp. SGAir0479]|uniref:hypothetical protein n=1 Tax=Rhodococcus sp. SGAir0479 TaxID=2567884 RepID=UPI0010CD1E91|nr:hypothetical protein [Rhodococcus sp. SGAir0479]QCQ92386.1 hypothetical protein E7742_14955 [Rhodococcus sp. SGAir0479]
MIFTSRRRARGGLRSPTLSSPAESVETVQTVDDALVGGDADAAPARPEGSDGDVGWGGREDDPDAISVTARWLVLTTDLTHGFARALLPESCAVPDVPQLAVWIVEPLSADSDSVGVPSGRLFAGMSCSCLLPGEQDESAFTSDLLVGAPLDEGDRDPFGLPDLPQTSLSLVNGVGGMGFSISPTDGSGRGVVGRVDLEECGSGPVQLTPDWLACQSWRSDFGSDGGAQPDGEGAGLVHTQWEVTRLSPIVSGSAVVECAEFGSHSYDLSAQGAALDARYGYARVAIVGRR